VLKTGFLEHQEANGVVGRNRALLPLERDGSESQRLSQRPSGAEKKRSRRPANSSGIFSDSAMYMPCVSVNWDTALAGKALLDSICRATIPR